MPNAILLSTRDDRDSVEQGTVMTVYRLIRFIRFIRFVVFAAAGSTALGNGPAYADFLSPAGQPALCPQCNQDGTWSVPSSPSRGGGTPGPSYTPSGPSPAELDAERRRAQHQKMLDTNKKGISHYEAGEFELAVGATPKRPIMGGGIPTNPSATSSGVSKIPGMQPDWIVN